MKIRLIVEGIVTPDEVRPEKHGVWCAEHIKILQKELPANLTTGNLGARVWQASPHNLPSPETIGSDDSHRGMLLGDGNHPL
jgi:hypothetical protein